LYGINETGKQNLFICEYPAYGNLSKYLDGGETSIWQSILDIALGLRFLHSRGIVHGDLKCHNFLVDRGGKAKLAGLEHYISVSEDTMQQEGKEEEKDISRSRTCSRWRAPECRGSDAGKDSFQSDVYSFGKCIIEALTGELPEGKHKPDFVTTGCLPNVPPSRCGQRQWCLIQEMCAENPAERPSMPAVVQQIARFIAVERAVRDTKSKKEEFRRVLQNNPCLETHLHAMVLDRMPKEETNYAKDRNERQQTLRDLVIIALDIIYQLSTCHDFKKQLETYTFKTCKTAENTTCRQNIHDGNIDLWHINGADVLRSGDALGRGAFARVYRGEWIGTQVAIKRWIKNDEDAIASFNKEVDVWYPLNHPHIINLYGACRIPTQDLKPMCVCDLAENGKVTTYLSKSEHKHEVWQILYEAALGLQGVHARGVVHSDLKCDNILVTTNGKAKISDFGLSFRNKSTSAEKENELRVSNETKPTTISKAGGALQWKAPEFLRGEPATQLSDIYSFGMCVIEAVTGNAPWNCKHDTTVKDCVTKDPPVLKKTFSGILWKLYVIMIPQKGFRSMMLCLQDDQIKR
ncbi:Serine/threonine protein kinase, partial [Phytophthora megakarya]